jgi:hypothetical protein
MANDFNYLFKFIVIGDTGSEFNMQESANLVLYYNLSNRK